MKAADIEWTMLRGALIGLAIAVVVSVAMIAGSYQFWESGQQGPQARRENAAGRPGGGTAPWTSRRP